MIRSIVVHDIPADSIAAMERWYHGVPVPPPPEAAGFGVFDSRVNDDVPRDPRAYPP